MILKKRDLGLFKTPVLGNTHSAAPADPKQEIEKDLKHLKVGSDPDKFKKRVAAILLIS